MEVAVYCTDTAVFKRCVTCVAAFEADSFVRVMRAIFGKDCIIEFVVFCES